MGNFLWMTIEFVCTTPSSNIHIGPPVPLGGISDRAQHFMVVFKTFLFFVGVIFQLFMYFFIYMRYLPMPENDDETLSNSELNQCLGREVKDGETSIILDQNSLDSADDSSQEITLAFLENAYIIFWISKDLFWSWGTGDLASANKFVMGFEVLAMFFGSLSIMILSFTAYFARRNTSKFIDSLTTIMWITANFVWMCGEFFIRYDNMSKDDEDEGNDGSFRLASSCLFCLGITLQIGNILFLSRHQCCHRNVSTDSNGFKVSSGVNICCNCWPWKRSLSPRSSRRIELFSFPSTSPNKKMTIAGDSSRSSSSFRSSSRFRGGKHARLSSCPDDDECSSDSIVMF